jgi:hypothetical protein
LKYCSFVLISVAALMTPGVAGAEREAKPAYEVELQGRVFVRDTLRRSDLEGADWTNELGFASARTSLEFSRADLVKLSIEVEFSDNDADLKDVYARVRPIRALRLQAGQFRPPISPISMESAWRLPVVERGLLNDRIVAEGWKIFSPLGSRTIGAQVEARPKLAGKPVLVVGVFNSRLPELGGKPEFTRNTLQDAYARIQVEAVDGLELGLSGAAVRRIRARGELDHAPIGSADLTWKPRYVRLWLEAFAGRSYVFDGSSSAGDFWAGRTLLAPRSGQLAPWLERFEPFVMASVFDASTAAEDNRAFEYSGGIALRFIKELRAQVHAARRLHERAYPTPVGTADSTVVYFQLGAAIR